MPQPRRRNTELAESFMVSRTADGSGMNLVNIAEAGDPPQSSRLRVFASLRATIQSGSAMIIGLRAKPQRTHPTDDGRIDDISYPFRDSQL